MTPKTKTKNTKNQPLPLFRRPKEIKVVTKKVLEKIADGIHNPKTGHYLNLCHGTLQNGPDPVCETRQMHCGLGELYFVVTGRHPDQDRINEEGVVRVILTRSTITEHEKLFQKQAEQASKKIKALGLPEDLTDQLLNELEHYHFGDEKEEDFRSVLNEIPEENDRGSKPVVGVGDSNEDFKARARRVADTLRKAAALLPR